MKPHSRRPARRNVAQLGALLRRSGRDVAPFHARTNRLEPPISPIGGSFFSGGPMRRSADTVPRTGPAQLDAQRPSSRSSSSTALAQVTPLILKVSSDLPCSTGGFATDRQRSRTEASRKNRSCMKRLLVISTSVAIVAATLSPALGLPTARHLRSYVEPTLPDDVPRLSRPCRSAIARGSTHAKGPAAVSPTRLRLVRVSRR